VFALQTSAIQMSPGIDVNSTKLVRGGTAFPRYNQYFFDFPRKTKYLKKTSRANERCAGISMKHSPREHQRVYLTFYLRVFEEDEFLGFMLDFSRNGLKIISEKPMIEGKSYILGMKVPSSLEWKGKSDPDRFIKFTAFCKWSKNDDVDKEFFLSGFDLTELHDEGDEKIIKKLLKEYRIR